MAINPLAPPVNYLGMLPQIDLAKQFEGLGEALVDRQKRTQTQEKQAAFTADFQNAKDNPTQENWLKMIATYPQYREAFTEVRKGFGEVETQKEFDAAFPISTAFDNGRPEIASKLIVDLIAARKNAKMPTQIYEQIFNEMELGNSKGAQAGVNYLLSNTNPERFEKFTKARIAAQSASDVLAKTTAESREAQGKADKAVSDAEVAALKAKGTPEELATEQAFNIAKLAKEKVDAEVAAETKASKISASVSAAKKAKVEADLAEKLALAGLNKTNWDIKNLQSQINDRTAKLNLDKLTTQATVSDKLSAIQQRLNEIPEGARKLINESATLSATSKQAATQYNDLASRIESAGGGKGRLTSATEWFATNTGQQDAWTQVRNEYTRVRNSVAIKALPPGVATDKDIELALKGIPPETANAATLASFLRGTAKLQDIDSSINNAKTDWLSQNNGLLTRAKSPFIAGDYAAKAGETFNDFAQRIVGDVSSKYRTPAQVAEDARVKLISQIPTNQSPVAAPTQTSIEAQADAILRGSR